MQQQTDSIVIVIAAQMRDGNGLISTSPHGVKVEN
jgi:hypothetical protein